MKLKANITAETIILGFTGSIGSGCTYIAKGLCDEYGFSYYSLSDILREIAKERKIKPTPKNLQDLGNSLRAKNTSGYLIELLFKRIKEKPGKGILIIDSIRNDKEVSTLKQFPYFFLFSIHADEDLRIKRTKDMGKFRSDEEFEEADRRDRAEDIPYGQQVKKCNYLADIIINNHQDIADNASGAKRKFFEVIYNDYIKLIRSHKEGKSDPENLPNIDETLMTMAYAESQRSSCLKRKVGAIVASVRTAPPKEGFDQSIKEAVHVLSNGHNEVPFGTTPCVFTEYAKCYRDYLQENQGIKLKYCPSCGREIKLAKQTCPECRGQIEKYTKSCPHCKKEFAFKYKCSGCAKEVFNEFLHSGGKLLGMCRSLHAEENALMNLTKIGGRDGSNLVLYTTTYPCNLCANKIVATGIKKIVYADPYPMKEAKDILKAGEVETSKFEGIKSSAFFRLYNF